MRILKVWASLNEMTRETETSKLFIMHNAQPVGRAGVLKRGAGVRQVDVQQLGHGQQARRQGFQHIYHLRPHCLRLRRQHLNSAGPDCEVYCASEVVLESDIKEAIFIYLFGYPTSTIIGLSLSTTGHRFLKCMPV